MESETTYEVSSESVTKFKKGEIFTVTLTVAEHDPDSFSPNLYDVRISRCNDIEPFTWQWTETGELDRMTTEAIHATICALDYANEHYDADVVTDVFE